VNSESRKPGPKPVAVGVLLFWENEWYQVFHGLVHGISSGEYYREFWEPTAPPKPTGREDLYQERIMMHNELMKRPEYWRRRVYKTRTCGVPAEPEIWGRLKSSTTEAQVLSACNDSPFWLNSERNRRPFVAELRQNASQFLCAKKYRYPAATRPSSEDKRILHFSRAMAGALLGLGAARAIDLIRLRRHGRGCGCVACEIR